MEFSELGSVNDHDVTLMISHGMTYDSVNVIDDAKELQPDMNATDLEDSDTLTVADLTAGEYSIASACFNEANGKVGPTQTVTVVDKVDTLAFDQASGGLLGALDLFGSLSTRSAS
ncbi:hypothetical protein [Tomitella cavernea]|uniref:hypothetical protein n=1 Tax=Tomitella cavernea TaxID=1387982 RepID=UPI0031E7049C